MRQVLAEAEEKQRLEIDFRENWTPQALRQVVRDHLHSSQVIIVSNREPYIHNYDADHRPVVQVPASGMVTALEPIMRACSGVWVAHGAGTADRETVDRFDHIARAARQSVLYAAAGLADRGAGAGLLLRIFQRGALAPVPSGVRAAGVSAERLARL